MKKNSFGLFLMFLLSVVSVEYCSAAAEQLGVVQEVQDCIICLEPLVSTQPLIALGCKHKFHKDCIMKWLKQSQICPLCKRVVDLSVSGFTPQEIANIKQDRDVNAQQAI